MHRLQRAIHTHNFKSHTFSKQRKHRILLWRGNIYSQRGQPILECVQFKNQILKKRADKRLGACLAQSHGVLMVHM